MTIALLRELIKAGYEEIIQNDLCRLFSRIHSSGSDGIVHYYCISENTYDEALDIFVELILPDENFQNPIFCFLLLLMDGRKEKKILKIRLSLPTAKVIHLVFLVIT